MSRHPNYHRNYNQNVDKIIALLQSRAAARGNSDNSTKKGLLDDVIQSGTTGALLGGMVGPGGMVVGAGVGAGLGLVRSIVENILEQEKDATNKKSEEQILRLIEELLQNERQSRENQMSIRNVPSAEYGTRGRSSGDTNCMCSQFQQALNMVQDQGLEMNITIRRDNTVPQRSVGGGWNHAVGDGGYNHAIGNGGWNQANGGGYYPAIGYNNYN